MWAMLQIEGKINVKICWYTIYAYFMMQNNPSIVEIIQKGKVLNHKGARFTVFVPIATHAPNRPPKLFSIWNMWYY